jgi:hypothetical protein
VDDGAIISATGITRPNTTTPIPYNPLNIINKESLKNK